ncbi:MAG: acyl-CoA dehydrogenase family protein [Gammaproteobacteria bacterium]|nr:acyl-CoA dehydrogenase family protein [Gammaproteobacteria bacterium]
MNVEFTAEEVAFQGEVRAFMQNDFPVEYRTKIDANVRLSKEEIVDWQKILYRKGWAAPSWPEEYGGTGWSQIQKHIFANEMGAVGAPEPVPFGMKMVAPIIMIYGNDEQKARFLPDILESNVWWCQGYSEPNAGSDLASLKTSAVRDGDHYIVNGAKTWNTYGQYADWIFCLVRTDNTVKKQEGISFLLIDMHSPGISLKPIVLIDGHPEVNEVFFDDVRVPVENLIGEENKGWTYAKVLLTHERTNISGVPRGKRRLSSLKRIAEQTDDGFGSNMMQNQIFKNKIASLEIELEALEYAELRTLASVSAGKAPGPESSILKIVGTELAQRIDEIFVELAALQCLPYVPEQFEDGFQGTPIGLGNSASAALTYFNNRKASIYGGSNEIQRNIICKAVLGL